MRSTTLITELNWIHDCTVLSIMYRPSSGQLPSIRLAIRCPNDLGYAPWEGKDLTLVAIDVAMSKHVVCGVGGPETVDAIRPGISAALRDDTMEAKRMGVHFPPLEFTISFHTGSALEIICRELGVEVVS